MKDPLTTHIRRVYKASKIAKVHALQRERARWLRKRTIAINKLAVCDRAMVALLEEFAVELDKQGIIKKD